MRSYRKKVSRDIDELKSRNPRGFWKLLKGDRQEGPNISIESLYDFFSKLNEAPTRDDNIRFRDIDPHDIETLNEELNTKITQSEILKCIKKLKNNKASGQDMIINEYITSTANTFIGTYEYLFNLIFETGVIPENWLAGDIKPIYKNKGDPFDPKNFRPITILSCLSKLFTSVLYERLNNFSDAFLILNENQFGFRRGYSTIDSLFSLHMLFEILKFKRKKLFCCFVDFEKAFDKVWREGLWYKLLLNNMNGSMYNVIFNLYNETKSRIVYNREASAFFPCLNGVRQGEKLSLFFDFHK